MHTQCYSETMSLAHIVLCLPRTHTYNTPLEPLGGVSNFVRSYVHTYNLSLVYERHLYVNKFVYTLASCNTTFFVKFCFQF